MLWRNQPEHSTASSVSSRSSRRSRSQSLPRTESELPLFDMPTPQSSVGTSPWSKSPEASGVKETASTEDQAVSNFLSKYVLEPCTESSSPGFLEHLPCLFKDVNVNGRYALRWAVQAAALADQSRKSHEESATKALECYGRALAALGQSLAEKGKTPDDYDLMTVVILDIFEASRPEIEFSGTLYLT